MSLDEDDTAEGGDAFNIINPFRPETQSTRMMQQSQILAADGRLFNRTEYIPPPSSTIRPPPSINTNAAQTSSNLNTRHLTRTTTHNRATSPIVDSDLDDIADTDGQPLIANRLASILQSSNFARPAKIVTKPQPFDSAAPGADPLAFMRLFEIAAKANNWNDAIKLQQFPTFLINKSLQWYFSLNDDRSRLDKFPWTWQELKQEFLDTGGSVETRKQFLGFKLQQQRQGKAESCSEFAIAMNNLCTSVNPNMKDEERVNHIMMNLQDDNRTAAYMQAPKTMEELTKVLARIDESKAFSRFHKDNLDDNVVFMNMPVQDRAIQARHPPPKPELDLTAIERRLNKLEVFCTNRRRYPDRRPIHQGYPNQQRYNTRQFFPRYQSQVAPRPQNFNNTYGQFRTPLYNPRANYQPNPYRQHPYPNRSGRPPLPISSRVNYADTDVNNNASSSNTLNRNSGNL
ncbi:unnamed protein product [Orchesella dallaii]|uniref:Retrotransposon gag domain-containing protein n=1 Tax=Orchesella dallaii TaxID=48710 RepID=A0ABP1Q6J7_9HEXA